MNFFSLHTVYAMFFTFCLIGCGGAKTLTPLTEEQKSQLNKLISDMKVPLDVANEQIELQKYNSEHADSKIKSLDSKTEFFPTEESRKDFQDHCIAADQSEDSGSGLLSFLSFNDLSYKVQVQDKDAQSLCPIALSLAFKIGPMKSENETFSLPLQGDANYEVRSEALKTKHDIQKFSYSGGGNFSGSKESAGGDFSVTGIIVSKAHGEITYTIRGNVKGAKTAQGSETQGDIYIRYQLSTFTAEFKLHIVVQDKKQTITYFLNDQEITPSEMKQYNLGFGSTKSETTAEENKVEVEDKSSATPEISITIEKE
jgi:hypothetical protein